MTTVLIEGFETEDWKDRFSLDSGAVATYANNYNRYGRYLLMGTTGGYMSYNLTAAEEDDVITIGMWWNLRNIPGLISSSDASIRFNGDSGATNHLNFYVSTTGQLQVRRGTATTLGTSDVIWGGTYEPHYVEIKAKLHDSAGTVDILSDGVSVLSLSSQDTKNGGTGTVIDKIHWASPSGNNAAETDCEFDDMYITNEQGSAPYDGFLGPIVVECLFPDGDGNYVDYTRNTGANDWEAVDEGGTHDGDTTYLESSTDTDRATFTFDNMTETAGTVVCVMASPVMRNTGAADNVQVSTRISSTDYDSGNYAVPSSYLPVDHIWEQSPATASDWTISEVNAAEFGIENTA